ncbi:DEAD/DEAH box helicase family protein [Chlamydia ibidis]|uniref:DEAD/DEAH box helicase family protein n=2 Tax=Chlamydia ibidis TaxID=1405396 RepID=S7J3G0_9CHLA|nr:DEAD/DEAH box helicase [Chlamydia ibidis]EPP34567.1 DEAD/DEAH box helicase family protein [Chlamydia ibidis]EQM62233.1 DEAD/DEAH box helicase family protein [Chlamydia ibidis 10-1398/6]
MLNFRKLRRDFTANILQDGKELFDQEAVVNAKILSMNGETVCIGAQIRGLYDNVYECEIEVDRSESDTIDSNCDCSYNYDCQHIVALLFYLEKYYNEMVVAYSREADLEANEEINDEVKKELQETFVAAATREEERKDRAHQKEIMSEYVHAANALSVNPFFLPLEYLEKDSAELAVLFVSSNNEEVFRPNQPAEFQLVLRLPGRSKPFYISNIKTFLEGVLYQEPIVLNGRRFFFTMQSFNASDRKMIDLLIRYVRYANQNTEEKLLKSAFLTPASLGVILAKMYEHQLADRGGSQHVEKEHFLGIFCGNLEEPLYWSVSPAKMKFHLDFFDTPYKALLMTPLILIDDDEMQPEQAMLLESNVPGVIHNNIYHRFAPQIKRAHLRSFSRLRDITIPEALFGSFRENALPVFKEYAEISNVEVLNSFVTLPYVDHVRGVCDMSYLDGELEAKLYFLYDDLRVPTAPLSLDYQDIRAFVREDGILARNLVEERKILEEVFSGFIYDERDGAFRVKSEKKIVEFMTETIPNNQHRITFNCPETLSDQFVYDETVFELSFREGTSINYYEAELKVHGLLKGITLDLLWDCISTKKRFLELPKKGGQVKSGRRGKSGASKLPCILVLDLEKIAPVVQIFNEIGFKVLDDFVEKCPLWSLTGISPELFKDLPVKFSITSKLASIQQQIRGEIAFEFQDVPEQIKATLRGYQTEGVHWLERLRKMHLNGILADDMGLGKTLQAIIAVTQSRMEKGKGCSLIVCPTSLVYNWKEEFRKFNPELKTLVVDGIPMQRRRQLATLSDYDVAITSYNLLQKDIDVYKDFEFDYVVLDEAHHIKNRTTRNAKSVKMIRSAHRLILTGTPIENSLEELWSLFDFLMPGLLSSYDRFVGKYIRTGNYMGNKADNMVALKKKVAPFILRRMKEDVLDDLPPVSEILYHCHLTDTQRELYHSYAASAKQELSRLVKQEGFERIHIHVLATLTRLKQICCHPAIFAKDVAEPGDSAKYDMLMDLLSSLVDSGHKTVVFSQYTKMLGIIRKDLEERGVPFVYLDGSTKNRLEIVNQFNEDPNLLVFLISLKAGGTGLNLVGADTVIHYDMWWNPAVENQATDRVHRIGQNRSVSSYKLVTLNTIEEKILSLQNRKKSLVKKVINSDDEVVSKLTWEEVLELLQI